MTPTIPDGGDVMAATQHGPGSGPGHPDPAAASWSRWAGRSGLLASAAFVASAALTTASAIEEPDGPGDMGRYLADLADVEAASVLYGIAGLALCALYVPFALAVAGLLRDRPTARLGAVAVVVGLGLVWVLPPSENAVQTLVVLANVLAAVVVFVALNLRLVRVGGDPTRR